MKYVLVVMYLFTAPDGGTEHTQFEMDFDTRQACFDAIAETETKVMSRVEARALTLTCRPKTPWDNAISWNAYMQDEQHVAER